MFQYDDAYKDLKNAVNLDPIQISMAPSRVENRKQNGIFGVLRDAGPDTWGESVLKRHLGLTALDPFQVITLAGANGSGRVATGELTQSRMQPIQTLEALQSAADKWSKEDLPKRDAGDLDDFLSAYIPSPTLGGAKPKIELLLNGDQWIAKFPDKGDSPEFSVAEAAALSLARECGIETPDHQVKAFGDGSHRRIALLTRRFDRQKLENGYERFGYASAMTVMGLDTGEELPPVKAYYTYAHEARRWAARGGEADFAVEQMREIWRRIVFTGLIGNRDDHPRNQALIHKAGKWQLSPIFDVIPVERDPSQRCTTMHFIKNKEDGNRISLERLIEASKYYKWDAREAHQEIMRMAAIVHSQWQAKLEAHGASTKLIGALAPTFGLAAELMAPPTSNADYEPAGPGQ